MKLADLHIHTHFSDSTSSPEEVIRQAVEQELSCIAITDHDIVGGIAPAMALGQAAGIEVIPGIELSSELDGKDIHILGYCFDYEDSPLTRQLAEIQQVRISRIAEMLEKLKELGIDNITLEEVCSRTVSDAVGRPHLAALLVEKGWVKSIKEAFNKYLADGAPACAKKFKMSPEEAIDLIRQSGGVPVLAHPMLTQRDEIIPRLVRAGLQGLEVYYANCSDAVIHYYEKLARKHKLVMTGGSDAHGDAKSYTWVGKVKVPYTIVDELRERAELLKTS